jgi:DNA polymerase III alpha subunit
MSSDEKSEKKTDLTVDAYGRVLVTSGDMFDLIYNGYSPETMTIVPDDRIDEYNQWCKAFQKTDFLINPAASPSHTPEEEHARRSMEWFIPDAYHDIDMRKLLLGRCVRDVERDRVNMEMDLFEARALLPLLKLMVFLVDHFRENAIVWGVGRGSSCASYCLFLIGVHKVDALTYDLDIKEFLKD